MGRLAETISTVRSPSALTGIVLVAGFYAVGLAAMRNPMYAYYRETVATALVLLNMALGLNIILGMTGYVSFGHVVFFGMGGYVAMALLEYRGWSIYAAMLVAALAGAILALGLGLIVLRLRGAYFAIATIGLNEAIRVFFENYQPLGGANGIELHVSRVAKLRFMGYQGLAAKLHLSYLLLATVTLIAMAMNWFILKSRFGMGLLAIREDEDAAESMGVNTWLYKTLAYMLSAIPPDLAGAVFAWKSGSIYPNTAFDLTLSIEGIIAVMLGGAGTFLGTLLGALTYSGVKTYLLTSFPHLHIVLFGIAIMLIVEFLPEGVIGWVRIKYTGLRRMLE
jgi:branched-chain amino acid transport system permease protein